MMLTTMTDEVSVQRRSVLPLRLVAGIAASFCELLVLPHNLIVDIISDVELARVCLIMFDYHI
jgi:hypothetical protein